MENKDDDDDDDDDETYNELHTLNLKNILRMIKSKRMKWARDVAHILVGQKRNAEYLKQQDYASDLGIGR